MEEERTEPVFLSPCSVMAIIDSLALELLVETF